MDMTNNQEFSARAYQIDLFEKAFEENCIIYLPTGSGKTYIAVLLIKKLGSSIQPLYSEGGKRTIFIVNTKALSEQQSVFLNRHTGFICKSYTGDLNVDAWKLNDWKDEFENNQVLVMTAQIFLDILTHGYMSLSRVNLIIFDECHHAVKEHPMRLIMQQFKNWPKAHHPRVLGMSASLLNSNVGFENVQSTLKELQITFHAKITTVDLDLVRSFSTNPQEAIVRYEPLDKTSVVVTEISKIVEIATTVLDCLNLPSKSMNKASSRKFQPTTISDKLKRIFLDVSEDLNELGVFGGCQSVLFHIDELDRQKNKQSKQNIANAFEYVITQFIKIQQLLKIEMADELMPLDFIYKYSSPKVIKLAEILKSFYEESKKDSKFCCIIFVQRRFIAKVLCSVLKELKEAHPGYSFLNPDFITGYNGDPFKNVRDPLTSSNWAKDTLSRFRLGMTNCLVATDVIDEGVDVPSCTLVLRYQAPYDFRAYIQSKGRARHATSKFIILASSQENYEGRYYRNFEKLESHLKQALHNETAYQNMPTKEEIDKVLYDYTSPQYVIDRQNGNQSIITEHNAIALINSYCASLLKSRYTSLTPTWVKKDITTIHGLKFKVHLTLPPACPLRDTFVSDEMSSPDIAKRSAAFKACVALQKAGELDDKLMPKRVEDIAMIAAHLFPSFQDHETNSDSLAGTNAKKRKHKIVYPKAFSKAYPQANETVYLHVIETRPFDVESIKAGYLAFYCIFESTCGYAILSSKKMPEIPSFPVYMNFGDVNVTINVNNKTPKLSKVEITALKDFHSLIFHEVLGMIKDFIVFDNDNMENSFLVVPVNEKQEINWDMIYRHKTIVKIPPTKSFDMKNCDYNSFDLITPNYRGSNVYIVTQIREDLTPKSSFPSKKYTSYAHYFKKHYGINIQDHTQPLLKVKEISNKIDAIRLKKTKTNLVLNEVDNDQHLIAELCDKIDFPAIYWLKALVLPIVLHRINQLVLAEDLRILISQEARLNIEILELGHRWQAMHIDESSFKDTESSFDATLNDISACQLMNEFTSASEILVPDLKMLTMSNPHGPSPADILKSLTVKKSNEAFNLELTETLGDAFLKFAVSLYLFQEYSNFGEGPLSYLKQKIISNLNLYYLGKQKNIPGRINIEEFLPATHFITPAYSIERKLAQFFIEMKVPADILHELKIPIKERFCGQFSNDTFEKIEHIVLDWTEDKGKKTGMEHFFGVQFVPDKSTADCVESLIGMYLVHLGIEGALKVLKWFEILPKTLNINEYLYSEVPDPKVEAGNINELASFASRIERKLGYRFKNRAFLLQAFTHQTYADNRVTPSYERLEFLGDAILDIILTVHIYEKCKKLSPGELTDLRSALVNNITFACLSVRYELHSALLAYAPSLFDAIDKFVSFQEDRNHKITDELFWVLLEESDCRMSEHVDVPKVLSDIYESVIGAIYLDSGKDLNTVWQIVYRLMHREIESFSKNVPKQAIRMIFETPGCNPVFSKSKVVEGTDKVMVSLTITVDEKREYFHGFGVSQKLAKCAACKQALKYLHYKGQE